MGDGLSILDKDLRYLYVNKTILDRWGSNTEDFLGKSLLDVHLNLQASDRIKGYQTVLETGKPILFNRAMSDDSTRFFRITAFRIGDKLGILTKDLTQDVTFENTLLELHRHADQLMHAKTLDKVYSITLEVMRSVLKFGTFDILMKEGDRLMQMIALNLPIGKGVPLDSNGVTVRAFKQQKTMRVADLRKDDGYYIMINPEKKEHFEGYAKARSEIATPIIVDSKSVDILNVEHLEPDQFNRQHQQDSKHSETRQQSRLNQQQIPCTVK